MLLALVFVQTQDKVRFPDILVAPQAPMAQPVQMMPPLPYTIRRERMPPETKTLDKEGGGLNWNIAGKWIHIKCPKEGNWIFTDDVWAGRDGSVLLEYEIGSEPASRGSATLTDLPDKEWIKKAYDPESFYQDPKNDVSMTLNDDGSINGTLTPTGGAASSFTGTVTDEGQVTLILGSVTGAGGVALDSSGNLGFTFLQSGSPVTWSLLAHD